MKIVGMECGGATAALVALDVWGERAMLAGRATIEEPRGLSRLIMTRFDAVLRDAGWRADELDGLAVGIGPGSWTSLRIGLSTFKTLAQTLNIPLAGVPTFDALASAVHAHKVESAAPRKKSKRAAFEPQILLAVAPCRPGEYYGKVFEMTQDSVAPAQGEWIADAKMHLDAAYCQGLASEIEPPLMLCGEAAPEVARLLEARGETYALASASPDAVALEIALGGAVQIASGEAQNPLEVAPLYLAPSGAERHWAARSGGVSPS